MKQTFRSPIILVIAIVSLLGSFSIARAQYYDGFDYGGFNYGGYSNFGYYDYTSYNPCGFGGCGYSGDYSLYDYGNYSGIGCGSFCSGGFGGFGGYYPQPFAPFFLPSQSSTYAPSSVYAPTTITKDDHSIVTTTINTTAAPMQSYYPQPIYISQPVYTAPVYTAPPVYYPPPVHTPPPVYQQPIICSAQFTNFNPPKTATSWQLYEYRVTAASSMSGQMSYRLVTAPDGMGITTATGQITWTPGTNQARNAPYQVTVAAYNGSCETAQTFQVMVQNPQVIYTPPPTIIAYDAPKPKPAPVCGEYPCPKQTEKPVKSTVCPPTQITPNTDAGNGATASVNAMLVNAASGFWGGIKTILTSPFTLLLIIVILAILLARARRRMQETRIVI